MNSRTSSLYVSLSSTAFFKPFWEHNQNCTMSINILLRPYWQQGEKTLIHMLKRPLLWTEKDACSMRKSFTFRLHTNTPIRIKVAKIVSLNRPCCCWSPSHLKGHPSYCKRLINTQSYSQKQTPSALRPLDEKAKLLWDFVIARNVQTASPAEKGLTLDDPDFRNFVLDVLRRYSEAEEMVTRANIPEKERKRASKLISELSLAATKIQEWLQLQKDVQTVQQLLEGTVLYIYNYNLEESVMYSTLEYCKI